MPRKHRSLMQQSYDDLKRRIITLELKPGQRLDDYELSMALNFSRTPVREAIFRLGAEGWVDVNSKAGFIVRSLDLDDIAHLCEARVVLSKAVARFAAQRAKPDEIDAMHVVAQEVEEAIDRRDYLAITDANARLHRLEAASSHNTIIETMSQTVYDQGQRLAYLCFGGAGAGHHLEGHFETVVSQHRAMISALAAGDAQAAEAVALEHVRLFRRRVQDYIAAEIDCGLTDEDLAGIAFPGAGSPSAAVPRTQRSIGAPGRDDQSR
ncbi:MAG: GntR family transcriptional regulator, partial [Acidimicrobiia bacterium]